MKSEIFYEDIYERNIQMAKKVLKEYNDEETAWQKFYKEIYKDPDGYPIEGKDNTRGGASCTADALFSAWRIYNHEGFNRKFIKVYKKYRKEPIFFFPREKGGINQSRAAFFGDRIDHFLFDLKQYCLGEKSKLESVYQKEETKKWLESFSQVNRRPENLEVFDLEKTDGSIIESYSPAYPKEWSTKYYINLKKKMDIYIKNNKGAS